MMRAVFAFVVGVAAVIAGAGSNLPAAQDRPAPAPRSSYEQCVDALLAELNPKFPDQPATVLALAETACQNSDQPPLETQPLQHQI